MGYSQIPEIKIIVKTQFHMISSDSKIRRKIRTLLLFRCFLGEHKTGLKEKHFNQMEEQRCINLLRFSTNIFRLQITCLFVCFLPLA